MSIFPGAISSFAGFTSSHTLAADQHASQHNSEQAEIIAAQTKIGTGASTPASGLLLRGNGAGTSAWAQANLISDVTGVLPIANGGTGGQTNFLAIIYPVGCIYTEITGTNPGTTFGFGTWSQFGQGQVLVGQKTADTNFGTVLAAGGEATHALTIAEIPAHTHPAAQGNFNESLTATGTSAAAGVDQFQNTARDAATASTGGSGAHNNLQPFIVVYFWRRTA